MHPKTRIALLLFGWFVSWASAAVLALLGFDSQQIILAVFGDESVTHAKDYAMSLDAETARWLVALLALVLFMFGALILIGIPIFQVNQKQRKLEKNLKEIDEKRASLSENFSKSISEMRRREKTIRCLHDKTYRMLVKIRARKTGKKCPPGNN